MPLAAALPHFGANRPSALVLLTSPRASPAAAPAIDRLQTGLGLTAAEGEVVASLAEGRSVRTIAEQSHRAEATVRWHIKRIKEKLGVSRQVDLVRLALSVADPGLPRPE